MANINLNIGTEKEEETEFALNQLHAVIREAQEKAIRAQCRANIYRLLNITCTMAVIIEFSGHSG